MSMPAALKTLPEGLRPSERASSWPGSPRKYDIGQEVRVKMHNMEWQNGCIVAFGNQEYLPLYWVRIDKSAGEAPAFEFELSSRSGT